MDRPQPSEFHEFYAVYVDQVGESDVLDILEREIEKTLSLLGGIDDPSGSTWRYAPGKWTLNEVLGHMADMERTFGFRAFWIARAAPEGLPGVEQDDFARESRANARTTGSILDEFAHLRRSNLALFRTFDETVWMRRGIASGFEFTVRSFPYILAGHEIHHRRVIEERYLAALRS